MAPRRKQTGPARSAQLRAGNGRRRSAELVDEIEQRHERQYDELRRRAAETIAEAERRVEARLDTMPQAATQPWSEAEGGGAPMLLKAPLVTAALETLVARRARAYVDLPGVVLKCRSPRDLVIEQMLFAERAFADYQTAALHMLRAW
jgi:hypothetical protein